MARLEEIQRLINQGYSDRKIAKILKQINETIRGWAEYYRHTNGAKDMRMLQQFICNRVRRCLQYRRKGRGFVFGKYPNEKLFKMGLIQTNRGWVQPRYRAPVHAPI